MTHTQDPDDLYGDAPVARIEITCRRNGAMSVAGSIEDKHYALAMLDNAPEFAPAIGLIDVSGDIETLLAELTEIFARIYLANANEVLTTIVFIHGVTSLTALGGIIPFISETTARLALRFAWQSGCALYACFGTRAMAGDIEPCAQNAETLTDRALANGDEHVIKFTEACLRRNAVVPSPVYHAAVGHTLGTMRRR